jgi:stage IV sporulation protein B
MPVREGEMVRAEVRGCVKGTPGTPGELCGFFQSDVIGSVELNCPDGVYGTASELPESTARVPVALTNEVTVGKAQIIATVDKNGPQRFDIEITRFFRASSHEKNMMIRVTDQRLLKVTGGIVQGMSGSPILQNGKLAGAVTHVFVNDPEQGYAIFAESMVKTAEQLARENRDAA